MSMPTPEELQAALREAARMREQGEDPRYVAKSLLSLNYRMTYLMRVLEHAERYLQFGLSAQGHLNLQQAVEAARAAIDRNRVEDEDNHPLI